MMNLYYRGYVIHEDIRSICYTVLGRRPKRTELGTAGTVMEAMRSVDLRLARRVARRWLRRDTAPDKSREWGRPSQPALL